VAESIERTESSSSSSASALGARTVLPGSSGSSRKKTAPAPGTAPYEFRQRNLGLTGDRPEKMDVARGHYLDILA
jgi:hypothetical protein